MEGENQKGKKGKRTRGEERGGKKGGRREKKIFHGRIEYKYISGALNWAETMEWWLLYEQSA